MLKKLVVIAGLVLSLNTAMAHAASANPVAEPEFVILICSYKNEKYAYENLKSACHQVSTKPYHIICVNDCSPDRTGEIMDAYVKEHNLQSKVTVIHNKERVGVVANIYNAVHSVEDHKIIVSLDGDDTLAHNNVLLRLEEEYKDPDVWLTFGSFTPVPGTWKPDVTLSEKDIRSYKIRERGHGMSHLKTYKAGLFKKIKKEDLLYEDGKYYPMAGDVAVLIPMLEMAAPIEPNSKIRFRKIDDILYNYRTDNPLSDFRVDGNLQVSVDKHIRNRQPYKPVAHL